MANTGYKVYLNRRRLILDTSGTIFYNGATWSTDLTEPNTDAYGNPVYVGLGPYFPPVFDTTLCPIGSTSFGTFVSINVGNGTAMSILNMTINGISLNGASFPYTIGNTSGGGTTSQVGISEAVITLVNTFGEPLVFRDSNSTCYSIFGSPHIGSYTATFSGISVISGMTMSLNISHGITC